MKTKATSKTTKKPAVGQTTTKAGARSAVPVRLLRSAKPAQREPAQIPAPAPKAPSRPATKKARIEALMRRPEGTAIADLMAATGWQEHSIRAALTGLRKAGVAIARERNDGPTRYRIVGPS